MLQLLKAKAAKSVLPELKENYKELIIDTRTHQRFIISSPCPSAVRLEQKSK